MSLRNIDFSVINFFSTKKNSFSSSVYEVTFKNWAFYTVLDLFDSRPNYKYINIDKLLPSLKFCHFELLINYANIFE